MTLLQELKSTSQQAIEKQTIASNQRAEQEKKQADDAKKCGVAKATEDFAQVSLDLKKAAQEGKRQYRVRIYQSLCDEEMKNNFYVGYEQKMTALLKAENLSVERDSDYCDSRGTYEYFGHETNDLWLDVSW